MRDAALGGSIPGFVGAFVAAWVLLRRRAG
jgi:hypothetical protein